MVTLEKNDWSGAYIKKIHLQKKIPEPLSPSPPPREIMVHPQGFFVLVRYFKIVILKG